jgi:transposase
MNKRYVVNLTDEERADLNQVVTRARVSGLKRLRASMLLKADEGMTDAEIAEDLGVGIATVERVRRRCCERGVAASLERKLQKNPSRPRKMDGVSEAQLVRLACSKVPLGRARWTLSLLADKLVELKIFESVSKSTVQRALKKNELKPWQVKRFCIPPEKSAPFVCAMEDVLDVYHRPYDPARPLVCVDETSKQLLAHTRAPIAASRGAIARVDDEYQRCGTANIFVAIEPLTGDNLIEVTERRTSVDFASFLRRLSDEQYPHAERIVLVMDNLSIHSMACFYEAYSPEEARRLTLRFEIHHTPKHGSWLNVAEIFLSTLSIQCLNQRIDSKQDLCATIDAWRASRPRGRVNWRFSTDSARIKLKRLYPSIP